MKATFYNSAGDYISYDIGDEINLQDAFNATKNNLSAPTNIVISQEENQLLNTAKGDLNTKNNIGRHSEEDILSKYNLDEKKLALILEKGAEHELEHTDDYDLAMAIARDHIYNNVEYYQILSSVKLARGALLKHSGKQAPRETDHIALCVPSALQSDYCDYVTSLFGSCSIYEKGDNAHIYFHAKKTDWDNKKRAFVYGIVGLAKKNQQENVIMIHNNRRYCISASYHDPIMDIDNINTEDI